MLKVEIADTPYKQRQGLMFRRSLPEDHGMMFVFNKPDILKFWGVNTYIPLDIAFVTKDNRISDIGTINPLSEKIVESSDECRIAIEANLGFFNRNKISVGDIVIVDKDDYSKTTTLFFKKDSKGNLLRKKIAQRMVGWDSDQMEPSHIDQDVDWSLPVVSEDELHEILEDSIESRDLSGPEDEFPEQDTEPITDEERPFFANIHDALDWAEEKKEVIKIWYNTLNGNDIERVVEPHGRFNARTTGNNILVTYDRSIGDIRAFITENILYHTFVNERFKPKFVVAK